MTKLNISFVGAGRVASALCKEMYCAGHRIDLIVSESELSSRMLAEICNANWSADLVFPDSSDIIIVAVQDQRLESILGEIRCNKDTLIIHTAGSYGLSVFQDSVKRKGVFYPLQTFSTSRKVVFKDLPFFIESSDTDSGKILRNLAESLGGKVYEAYAEDRRMLHLAAVFACNFTNYMLTISKEVAGKSGFSFEVLEPLIKETLSKAMDIGPENAQTGPAVRNDQTTIVKHYELLSYSPELQKIYSNLTLSIIEHYKQK